MQTNSADKKNFFDSEIYLITLMSVLLGQEVVVITENEATSSLKDDLILNFGMQDKTYSISFDHRILTLISRDKKNWIIDIIQKLTNSKDYEYLGKPHLIERKEDAQKLCNYSVFNKIGQFKYLGKVGFNYEFHNNYQKIINLKKTQILPTQLFLKLGLTLKKDEIIQSNKVEIKDQIYIEAEFLVNNQKYLLSEIDYNKFKICDLGVIRMENMDLILNIELGKLEISLEDFVNLRVGSVLNFEIPSNLEVVIKLGSKAWAMAEIMSDNSQTTLKVNKIIELDSLKHLEAH